MDNKTIQYSMEYCESLPKFGFGLSFVGWAYNEEENITEYLDRVMELLDKTVEDYEIIVVNDGSTDRTREIILEYSAINCKIKLVDNPGNMGVAYAARNAIMRANKKFVMWQTVDWSYDISHIRCFLDVLETRNMDVIAGVRRRPVEAVNKLHKLIVGILRLFGFQHITRRSDTLWKAFVSINNYMLIRILFGVPLSDYQNVCIYRTELIQSINPETNSSFVNPEYLFKAFWQGANIAEVPINFIPRQKGKAKGTKVSSIAASLRDIFFFYYHNIVIGRINRENKGTIIRLESDVWSTE